MNKLILCSIVKNEERWLPLMLKSVIEGVDKVVIVDSGSTDKTKEAATKICREHNTELYWFDYKRENTPKDDGRQRNIYLKYLIENHLGDWALVLDADEIVCGNIKKSFKIISVEAPKKNVSCLHLEFRHLIGDFGHEDATKQQHITFCRMFKVKQKLFYPETEHNVLEGYVEEEMAVINGFKVWHFAHARHAFYWKNKYEHMIKNSNIHSPENAEWWYYSHLFGYFPRKPVDHCDLPNVIKDEFFAKYEHPELKSVISIGTVPDNVNKVIDCVRAIEKHTHEDHQTIITTNDYKGFFYGHNRAMNMIKNDNNVNGILLLNDDACPRTFSWLQKLRDASFKDGKYSIVGTKDSLRDSEFGEYIAFYCVYIPRQIIYGIGLLDDRFKIGEWEDLDYCLRAKKAGFGIEVIDEEVVNHSTSHTMGDMRGNLEKERLLNRERFYNKWSVK